MGKATAPENGFQDTLMDRFDLSHLENAIQQTIVKTQTSRAAVIKTDHNEHAATDRMTKISILDDEAIIVQPGHQSNHARIAKELITLPENVKLALIA